MKEKTYRTSEISKLLGKTRQRIHQLTIGMKQEHNGKIYLLPSILSIPKHYYKNKRGRLIYTQEGFKKLKEYFKNKEN